MARASSACSAVICPGAVAAALGLVRRVRASASGTASLLAFVAVVLVGDEGGRVVFVFVSDEGGRLVRKTWRAASIWDTDACCAFRSCRVAQATARMSE